MPLLGVTTMGACLKLCKKCSGVSPKDFKGVVAKGDIRTGCFGHCAKKHKELEGKAYVKYDGAIVTRGSKKKLVKAVAECV